MKLSFPCRFRHGRKIIATSLFGVVGIGLAAQMLGPATAFDPLTDALICSSTSPFTSEAELGEPAKFFEATVPDSNPLPNATAPAYEVAQGEVIQVRVGTGRPGSVAMHGILEGHALRTHDYVFVRLKVKYSGRFPLHFHGKDGSHFEIAVFEVSPQT